MADYTSVEQVQNTLPKAVQSSTQVDSSAISHFIDQAESIVNGTIGGVYSVPVSGSPPMLQTISTDLAIYRLLRRQFTQDQRNTSDWVEQFKAAKEDLKDIAEGKLTLVDSAGDIITVGGAGVWSNTMDYTPTMDEDSFTRHHIDPDKLDDIEDKRDS